MSEKTTNYKLTKLDSAEIGSMIDLNSNADKLDAALKQNHDAQQAHGEDQNNPHRVTKKQVGLGNVNNTADKNKPVSTAQQIALDGKADLGTDGRVPASQLPSYVDDVLEYGNKMEFPNPGESGKIYVATDTNLTYRWSGTAYVEISPSLALGETANTAYRGDLGKQNAENLASLSGVVSGKAAASHTHSAADVTSGTLPVARGGTGQMSIAGLRNTLGITNYITEEYDSGNWHVVKYANGSCEITGECGFHVPSTGLITKTIPLPVTLENTNYNVQATPEHNGSVITKMGAFNSAGTVEKYTDRFVFSLIVDSVWDPTIAFNIKGTWK